MLFSLFFFFILAKATLFSISKLFIPRRSPTERPVPRQPLVPAGVLPFLLGSAGFSLPRVVYFCHTTI